MKVCVKFRGVSNTNYEILALITSTNETKNTRWHLGSQWEIKHLWGTLRNNSSSTAMNFTVILTSSTFQMCVGMSFEQ